MGGMRARQEGRGMLPRVNGDGVDPVFLRIQVNFMCK